MRDLSKAMLRFSWAMPLLSVQQMVNLLRNPNQSMDEAAAALDALSHSAEEQLGEFTKPLFKSTDDLQSRLIDSLFGAVSMGGSCGPQPCARPSTRAPAYKSDPQYEEVIARYSRGTGKFSKDKRFIALKLKVFTLDGQEDGVQDGVWEANFKDPKELLSRPAPPQGPMNEPQGPVPHIPVMAYTKARWTFSHAGSITVVGPASSHLVVLPDGSFIFMVSTAQIITGGTGRFEGAYGLVQSLGSTHIPKGVDLFGPQDVSFAATTLDTFKVVLGRDIGPAPPRPQPQPGPQPQPQAPPPMLPSAAPSSDYPYAPHYAEVNGYKMHYIEQGSGDPILFLHGDPTWSYLWRNVIPYVSPLGRCIAPDLIGMGRSDKPPIKYNFFDQFNYLEGFIQRLKLHNITLVLHDWGTTLGFHYAMRHERKIKGIAFLEAQLKPYSSWEDFPASLRDTFRQFRDPKTGWDLIIETNVMIEQVLPASVIRKLTDTEMNYYREPFPTPGTRRPIWEFINEIPIGGSPGAVAELVSNYSEKLQRSDLPKLLIYAEPGAITTAPDVAWAQAHLKNLQCVNIGPGIHFLQEDNPAAVGQAVASWYQQIGKKGE